MSLFKINTFNLNLLFSFKNEFLHRVNYRLPFKRTKIRGRIVPRSIHSHVFIIINNNPETIKLLLIYTCMHKIIGNTPWIPVM